MSETDKPVAAGAAKGEILDAIVFDQRKAPRGGVKATRSPEDPHVRRWLVSYLGRHKPLSAGVYSLVIASAVSGFAPLPFTRLLLDAAQNLQRPQPEFDRALAPSLLGRLFIGHSPITVVTAAAAILISVKLTNLVMSALSTYANDVLQARITRDIRADLFARYLSLPEDYHQEHGVGEMMARFTQDLNGAASIYTTVFFSPIIEAATLLISGAYLLTLDPLLGAVALGFAPVYYFVIGPLAQSLGQRAGNVSKQFAAVNEDLQETLSAVREIKSHGSESRERAEFRVNLDAHYHASLGYIRWQLVGSQSVRLLTEAAPLLVLVLGAAMIVRGRALSLGTLIVMFGSVGGMLAAMSSLANVRIAYTTGITFARTVWRALKEPTEEDFLSGPETLTVASPPTGTAIEFSHVAMTYGRTGYSVQDLTFRIMSGQSVAIVGEGGSGKSSAVNLLFKLHPYDSGSIKLFGQELRDLSLASARSVFGYMGQFPFFFQRSLRENLLYGVASRDEATLARMKSLCATYGIDELARAMPDGYDTVISARGANLSGSQQKRVALVRALMRDPPILLLDEPLSGLSPEQRREVSECIRAMRGTKTVVVITHDLELTREMDLVLVFKRQESMVSSGIHSTPPGTVGPSEGSLKKKPAARPTAFGAVVEQGSYESLRSAGGVFQQLLTSGDGKP